MNTYLTYILLFCSVVLFGQNSAFDKMVDNTLNKTVPFITSEKLSTNYNYYTILDTRELNEYNISHLDNAIHVGYTNFNLKEIIKTIPTNKPIVVYCSVGYRSEKIGEKLIRKGYIVYNLYGGIFEWKNKGNSVFDSLSNSTNKVHCYNSDWSKWLVKGEKIYD